MNEVQKSSSRSKILSKLKLALNVPTPMPFPQLDYNTEPFVTNNDALAIQFAKAFTGVQGKFYYCDSEEEFKQILNQIIQEKKLQRLHCWDKNILQFLHRLEFNYVSENDNIEYSEAAFTGVEALCARTGTILYTSAQSSGRTLPVFPPIQFIFAYTSQLVPDLKEAIQKIQLKYEGNIPSMISFTTGPSRTADIEKTLVLGAHGPREVFLFLFDK